MTSPNAPIGDTGKDNKELKISYVDESFSEKFDFEICGFGFDVESNLEKYIRENKIDDYESKTPEEQAKIRREAMNFGKLEINIDEERETVEKDIDKDEIENGASIKEKKADLDKVKRKADQIRKVEAEQKMRESNNKQGGSEKDSR